MQIHYQPNARELARASLLYAEKKPFLLVCLFVFNLVMAFFLIIFVIKLVLSGLNANQWVATLVCLLWLFGRRPFNEWLLYLRMRRSLVVERPIDIDVSRNGVIWSGKGLRSGQMSWAQMKYVMETKNGFILPNAINRFLWLPFRGFQAPDDVQAFKELLNEKQVPCRVYRRWEC